MKPQNTTNVLLIEDNLGDARLVARLLERGSTRFEVAHVESLAQGLRKLAEGGFDVILLDLHLPDSHGLHTLTAVLRAARDLPVVVLTGLDDDELGMTAVHAGAQDYLVKGSADGPLLARSLHYAKERKRADRTIRELSRRNEVILTALGEGVIGLDIQGVVTFVNHAVTRLTGWRPEQLVGVRLCETLFRQVGEDCSVSATLRDGQVREAFTEIIWHCEGFGFPAELVVTPMIEDGTITGAVLAFHDVSIRQEASEILRDQLEFQQKMIDALPIPLFYLDTTGMVMGCNRAFERLVGRSRAAMVGELVDDVLPPKAALWLLDGHEGGDLPQGELSFTLPGPEGERPMVLIRALFSRMDAVSVVLATIRPA